MAPDDFWSRKRKQEEEEEREREEAQERAKRESLQKKKLGFSFKENAPVSERFEDLMAEAPVLIEQLHHLYNQFMTGMATLPPREKRSRLDHIMTLLMNHQKATPSARFQFGSLHSSYTAHCARWDKLLHDVESGKIKRLIGAKKTARS